MTPFPVLLLPRANDQNDILKDQAPLEVFAERHVESIHALPQILGTERINNPTGIRLAWAERMAVDLQLDFFIRGRRLLETKPSRDLRRFLRGNAS